MWETLQVVLIIQASTSVAVLFYLNAKWCSNVASEESESNSLDLLTFTQSQVTVGVRVKVSFPSYLFGIPMLTYQPYNGVLFI